MPVLIDYSQIFISNFMQQVGSDFETEYAEGLVRHMVLQSLLTYKMKFSRNYGEPILCVDSSPSWRDETFKYYKYDRRRRRREREGKEKEMWDTLYTSLNVILEEIKQNFPYKVIQVDKAEADDIIGVLSILMHKKRKVLIVSGDKDFKQLLRYPNVEQYSTSEKAMVTVEDPDLFLKEMFIQGDKGDGIPNFLSPSDIFTEKRDGERQRSVRKKLLAEWLHQEPEEFCKEDDEYLTKRNLKRYKMNRRLIDLRMIPRWLAEDIVETYNSTDRGNAVNYRYFAKHSMIELTQKMDQFNSIDW